MDILRIFSRKEPIAGLEVSDETLRLVFLTFNKKKFAEEIEVMAEENLPPEAIKNGSITDEKLLLAGLQNLLKLVPAKLRYIILSLPIDNIYTRIFSFPNNIDQDKLKESIQLVTQYQLPFKTEEVYLDWQKLENPVKNEIFLAAVPKATVNQYVNALARVGLRTVAVELHPVSFLRVANIAAQKSVLVSAKNHNTNFIYIIKDKVVRYSKALPTEFVPIDKTEEEVSRITNFYEAENDPVAEKTTLNQLKFIEKYTDPRLLETNGGRWAVSLGAAVRGALPRSEDKMLSLLPIGTEKAYEYQRATAFSQFIATLILVIGIFFCGVYAAVWMLIASAQTRSATQNLSGFPLPSGTNVLETQVQKLNALTDSTAQLVSGIPNWSILFMELKARMTAGITISNITVTDPVQDMVIVGTAASRGELNTFKKKLEESSLIGNITLPLTNLEQKENIPFSITFTFKNPQAIYPVSNATSKED